MAPISSRGNSHSSTLRRRALGHYDKGEFDDAETLFLKVIDMCKCRAGQRQPCVLAEIITAIAKNDLKTALAKMTASSIRCDNPLHVDSFDSLIATYEKQGRIDDAFQAAAKFVNLCPREPKAFLRLGKLLRLKHDPNMAYLTYKQGIELVKRKNPGHAGLKTLCEHRDKVKALAKFDPLALLPIELVRIIFKHVDFRTQCRSLRVSKAWKALLTSPDCRDIWQTQVYDLRNASHPGLSRLRKAFQTYSKYANEATTDLTINGCSFFFQILKLPQLLSYSKTLKVLQLRQPQPLHSHHLDLAQNFAAPQLTSLYLGEGVECGPELLLTILQASADSLEELSLLEVSGIWWYRDWPRMEKLKVARISRMREERRPLNMGIFMTLTPNLEEAWLDCVKYSPEQLVLQWSKLRNLFLGEQAVAVGSLLEEGPFLNENLRELHLEGRSLTRHLHIPHLEKLEKLSLLFHDELSEREYERIVRPSMESGTLRELDIRPLPSKIFFPSILRPRPLPDWIKSDSIEYMSVSGVNSPGYSNFETVLPEIIRRFPNLRRVDIGQDDVPTSVLVGWIKGGVKVIHHRAGNRRLDLDEWARKEYRAKFVNEPPRHIPSMRPDRRPAYNTVLCAYHGNYSSTVAPR